MSGLQAYSPVNPVSRSTTAPPTENLRGPAEAPRVPRPLCCSCGRNFAFVASLCRSCYRSRAHSRHRFDGLREEILERDGRLCRACGTTDRLHVHHRKPGRNDRELLITVCAGWHARLHRLAALPVWLPDLIVALWIEQHPGVPVQLQLAVAA